MHIYFFLFFFFLIQYPASRRIVGCLRISDILTVVYFIIPAFWPNLGNNSVYFLIAPRLDPRSSRGHRFHIAWGLFGFPPYFIFLGPGLKFGQADSDVRIIGASLITEPQLDPRSNGVGFTSYFATLDQGSSFRQGRWYIYNKLI